MPTNWKNISFLILITNIFPETSFSQDISNHAFQFVTSVKQRGPVAYRDPLGAISPDGKLIAYTDSRKIVIHPIQGGASFELQKQGAFVRYITWTPDSKNLVTYELGGKGKTWYIYNLIHKNGRPLWPGFTEFKRSELRELTWSRNGDQVAGVVLKDGKAQLWEFDNEGRNARILTEKASLESVQWNPSNGSFAGIVTVENMRFIDLNLSSEEDELIAADSYGPIAFSSEGKIIYYTLANAKGTLDLWQHNLKNNKKKQITSFSKDTYAPVTSHNGKVLFKLKDYRIFIATTSADSGISQPITTFQSEIPYWHPDGTKISFTFGTWRRIIDDIKYPDIDQNLGVVDINNELPVSKPDFVVRASYSEDQGMCWSPNEKWIAFHTHADGTDDIWIQSVNDEKSGRPLSVGGYETGWPRWSPDGNWIAYTTAKDRERISKLFLIGVDQEIGQLTKPQKEIMSPGLSEGSFTDAQWTADSKNLVVEYVVDENHKEVHLIPIDGGQGRKIHGFQSNQLYSGISLSNDQKWVAYIAPDSKDNLQVFKVSLDGEIVKQITIDATDKAHPAFSPKTNTIAYSVFSYQVIFWLF